MRVAVSALALVLLAACVGQPDEDVVGMPGIGCGGGPCPVRGPTPVTPPDNSVFVSVNAGAMAVDATSSASVPIDIAACKYQKLHMWLPLGSAWFLVHPHGDNYCEMWLGGETENPMYDGHAAQYCLFERFSTLLIHSEDGGPIVMKNMPWCVLL